MGKIAKPVNVSAAVFARAVVFGVVEWNCLHLNYWRSLCQPHYRRVGWCCGMVSACCQLPC